MNLFLVNEWCDEQNSDWFCDICDKTIKIKSKSKHINSKFHKHKEKHSVVVKEYEFIGPDVDKIDYIFNNCAVDY